MTAGALIVPAVAACSNGSGGGPGTVKIGLLVSLSGVYKVLGEELRDGFQLYLDTHGGKLGGRQVELVVADEGAGGDAAVPLAEKLIKQDRVQVLTGIVSSATYQVLTPKVQEAKVTMIGANGRPAVDSVQGVWATSFITQQFGSSIAKYIKDQVDGPVWAMAADYAAGQALMKGFTDAFSQVGGQLANPDHKPTMTPAKDMKNFLPYLAGIKASGAKAVYCFYAGDQAVDFVKQYHQSDAADLPLYSAAALTEGTLLTAEGDAATGIRTNAYYASNLDNEANRRFVAEWDKKHPGVTPDSYLVQSYDVAKVLDLGLAAAGNDLSYEAINRALGSLGKIDSPRGEWQFSEKTHTPVQKWYMREVRKDGRALSNVVIQDLATIGD
ncbi:ABC transporter substrate-binding protein [Actinocrispum wychmicini]|nr:ABC transporter substrate-binding protein [Actinocrispum wychmicini]